MNDFTAPTTDTRLIERWLPIAALGEESVRERRSMTALPPTYYLHVWWARRPLVASRAAILASALPDDVDRDQFLHALGIHGDPVSSRRRIDAARRKGERFEGEAYSYQRAFAHAPTTADKAFIQGGLKRLGLANVSMLDPTAGGGSIPFEAARLDFKVFANDLNPVAALIEKATIEFPLKHGTALVAAFSKLADAFVKRREDRLKPYFPAEPEPNCVATNYLWARTVRCPYCNGLVPLSPNWRLAPNGTGARLMPKLGKGPGDLSRRCEFEIVDVVTDQSAATVTNADGLCPFPDCGRVFKGDEIKRQAQAGGMSEQLFAIVFARKIETRTKSGKRGRDRWERGYRAPRPEDDNSNLIGSYQAENIARWDALDFVPREQLPLDTESWTHGNTPAQYGARKFIDLFTPRQLLVHASAVEIFHELLDETKAAGSFGDLSKAAFIYLALSIDKMVDYNSRSSAWHGSREVLEHTFRDHAYPLKWSFAEIAPIEGDSGYDWAIKQTGKCIKELVALVRPKKASGDDLFSVEHCETFDPASLTITCKSGDHLNHILPATVDIVVMDPPYFGNVMYAELADFFYVWLKRTAGHVVPELFTRNLTDKENEAVANPAKFQRQKGAGAMAARDYRERMQRIFEECRRVLKPSGIMILMFTHKATGAWDALTKGLIHAGFSITASWPINTEAEVQLAYQEQIGGEEHYLSCMPPTCLLRTRSRLLGRCRAAGGTRRSRSREGVSAGWDHRRGPLPRQLWPSAGRIFPSLAVETWHAAPEARGSKAKASG